MPSSYELETAFILLEFDATDANYYNTRVLPSISLKLVTRIDGNTTGISNNPFVIVQ